MKVSFSNNTIKAKGKQRNPNLTSTISLPSDRHVKRKRISNSNLQQFPTTIHYFKNQNL